MTRLLSYEPIIDSVKIRIIDDWRQVSVQWMTAVAFERFEPQFRVRLEVLKLNPGVWYALPYGE